MATIQQNKNVLSLSFNHSGFLSLYSILRGWALANYGYAPVSFEPGPSRLNIRKLTIIPLGATVQISTKGETSGCIPDGKGITIPANVPFVIENNNNVDGYANLYDNILIDPAGAMVSCFIEM